MQEKARDHPTKTPLFSFVPPSAGMFVWVRSYILTLRCARTLTYCGGSSSFAWHVRCTQLKFHLEDYVVIDPNVPDDQTIDMKLWTHIADRGLLIMPGIFFGAQHYEQDSGSSQKPTIPYEVTYRVSFSMGSVRLCCDVCNSR